MDCIEPSAATPPQFPLLLQIVRWHQSCTANTTDNIDTPSYRQTNNAIGDPMRGRVGRRRRCLSQRESPMNVELEWMKSLETLSAFLKNNFLFAREFTYHDDDLNGFTRGACYPTPSAKLFTDNTSKAVTRGRTLRNFC